MLRCFTWTPESKLRAPCLHGKYSTTQRSPRLLLEDREKWLNFICVWWGHTCHGTPGMVKGQGPLGIHMVGVGSPLSCGVWGLDLGHRAWWQTLSPPLPSHLPMAIFYQSGRSINNVHESLHSRLTNRSILAFLPLSPCEFRVLRRCQLITPHPSRHHCPVPGGLAPRSRERVCSCSSVNKSPGCWCWVGFESRGGSALHTHPVSVITAAGAKIDVLGRGPPKVTKWDFTCPAEVYVQKEARHCNPSPMQIQQGGLGLSLLVTFYLVLDCVCLGQNASCRAWLFFFLPCGPLR